MEKSLVQFCMQRRYWLLLASLLLVIFSLLGLEHFRFDGSMRFFFGRDYPHLQAFNRIEEQFGRFDNTVILVSAQKGDLFTPKRLRLLEQMTDDAWSFPEATRVESIANYQYSWSEGDELIVEPFLDHSDQYGEQTLQQKRQLALADPSLLKRLISADGRHAAIVVNYTLKYGNERQLQEIEINNDIYAYLDKLEKQHPDLTFSLGGNVIGNAIMTIKTLGDMKTQVPAMYAAIFLLLAFLLRSFLSMLAIAFTAIVTCVSALGIACWLGVTLSPVSLTSVSIMITITIAHCVHIVVYFLHELREGRAKLQAINESLRVNLQPVLITSLTTALGFLSMNFNELGPAADLGNIVAIGVVLALLFSYTLLPSLLVLLPVNDKTTQHGTMLRQIDNLAEFVIRRRKAVLWVTAVVSIIMLVLASQNVVNDRFPENVAKPSRYRDDLQRMDESLGGIYTMEYEIRAKQKGGVNEPEYLQHLEAFTQWLRAQPEIINVYSYTDIIQRLNRNMHGDDSAYYRIPKNRELAAQYLLLYEMSLPQGVDINNIVSLDKSSTKLMFTFPTTDTHAVLALRQKVVAWQQQNLPEYMRHDGASNTIMWTYLSIDALTNSLQGALVALLLISLTLIVVLKSVRYGLISLAPNLLPAVIGFGLWFLYKGELNMALMNVLCITIGIVVDDTVHFMSKYLRARRELDKDCEEGVRYAFSSVGPALWITTVVLTAGFATLGASSFVPNSQMGGMIAVIIIAALLLDFLLLPAMLLVFGRKVV